jgi:antitoxin CptB
MSVDHADVRRLEWRCRRGMKELDILLTRYVRERFASADAAERTAFTEFLELPDPDLAGYLLAGVEPHDPGLASLCRRILAQP